MDIERVELLRGPQGTLFGKNVTGGAVNIVSAKPGPDFDASLTLRTAEQGDNDLRAMVNVPLAENLFLRVGLASETFDGYYYNRHLGKTVGAEDMKSASFALRATPGDWTLDFTTHLIRKRDDNAPGQCNYNEDRPVSWGGGGGRTNQYADGFADELRALCQADAAAGTFVNSSDLDTFSNIDNTALFGSAQWDSNGPVGAFEELTFRANASYRYNDYDYLQDRDMTFYAIDHVGTSGGTGNIGQDNLTRGFEAIFEGQLNDRTELTVGYNYFYEEAKNGDGLCRKEYENSGLVYTDDAQTVRYTGDGNYTEYDEIACTSFSGLYFALMPYPMLNEFKKPWSTSTASGGPRSFLNQSRVQNESHGIFAHLTYQISDALALDAGVRYTRDDREFWNMEWSGNDCLVYPNYERVLGGSYSPQNTLCSNQATYEFQHPVMSYSNIIGDGAMFNDDEASFDAVTPMLSLSYNLPESDMFNDALIYATYSQGFLTGGFNTETPSYVPEFAPLIAFDPEYVTNYELGFKGTLADGRVRINGDVFYMDYTDKQEGISVQNPIATAVDDLLGIVTNAASVVISGVELEVRAALWDGGFVSVDYGSLSNEYDEYTYTLPDGTVVDASAGTIDDRTPDSTLNIGLEHQFDLGDGSTLTPRLNIYSQGAVDYNGGDDTNIGNCTQPEYTKVGARVTYVPAGANWQASVFGQNITDERILESCGDGRDMFYYRHERPAYWGLEFVSRWGAGAN